MSCRLNIGHTQQDTMVLTRSMGRGGRPSPLELPPMPSEHRASGTAQRRKVPPSDFSDPALNRTLPTPTEPAVIKQDLTLLQLRALTVSACYIGVTTAAGLVSLILFWWLLIPCWFVAEIIFIPCFLYCYYRLNRQPQPHLPNHEGSDQLAVFKRFTSHKDKISRQAVMGQRMYMRCCSLPAPSARFIDVQAVGIGDSAVRYKLV